MLPNQTQSPTPLRVLRVLRLAAVRAKTGLPTSTLYAKMANGEFPRSVPIGERTVGWLESEIDNWIAGCLRKRDGVPS
jgi:prophage regulatory protein